MRVVTLSPGQRRWLPAVLLPALALAACACTSSAAPPAAAPQQPPAQQAQGPAGAAPASPPAQAAAKPLASAGVAEVFNPTADFGPAPDVDLPTTDGGTFNLARQQGKVTLVYLTPW